MVSAAGHSNTLSRRPEMLTIYLILHSTHSCDRRGIPTKSNPLTTMTRVPLSAASTIPDTARG
jgi:hypothetical protein